MTVAPLQVVCLGAATLDAIVRVGFPVEPGSRQVADEGLLAGGGVAATAAVALARLGISAGVVAAVGSDPAGDWIRRELAAEGLDVGAIQVRPGRSATSVILIDRQAAERAILHAPGGGALELDEAAVERCRRAAWIHLDWLGHRLLPQLRAAGVAARVSVDDGNPIPDLDLAAIDLYAPTAASLSIRYPEIEREQAVRRALGEGPRMVAVTLGADGSLGGERLDDGRIRLSRAKPLPVEPVSTLGAGDVFHGALLAGLLRGQPLDGALAIANAAAALACRALDGRSRIPDWTTSQAAAAEIGVASW